MHSACLRIRGEREKERERERERIASYINWLYIPVVNSEKMQNSWVFELLFQHGSRAVPAHFLAFSFTFLATKYYFSLNLLVYSCFFFFNHLSYSFNFNRFLLITFKFQWRELRIIHQVLSFFILTRIHHWFSQVLCLQRTVSMFGLARWKWL